MLLAVLGTAAFSSRDVLEHRRLFQQERDRHQETLLREHDQHTDVMLLLGRIDSSAAFTVDLADVIQRIRVIAPPSVDDLSG